MIINEQLAKGEMWKKSEEIIKKYINKNYLRIRRPVKYAVPPAEKKFG